MDSLICNAHDMLKEYFDPKYAKYQIPYDFFHDCKGIMFLRIWKAGLLIGGIGGTGIVLARNNGEWSNPCAVSLSGIQFGLDAGVETVDDILLLRDDVVLKLLVERGHCKFGSDAHIVTDPFGANNNVDATSSGVKSNSVYAYSFSNGAFIGLSLNSGTVSVNNSVNDEFYDNRKIEPKDMLYGDIIIPQNGDFFQLKQLLKDYCANESKAVHKPISDQNMMDPIINQ
jgi:lipid-binding SYLF domain-containing protein